MPQEHYQYHYYGRIPSCCYCYFMKRQTELPTGQVDMKFMPKSIKSCPFLGIDKKTLYKRADQLSGWFAWVCFVESLKPYNGWWRINYVAGDERHFVVELERPNNIKKMFQETDILDIGPGMYQEAEGPISIPPVGSPATPCNCWLPLLTIYEAALKNLGKIICISFKQGLEEYNGYWTLMEVNGDRNDFVVTLGRPNDISMNFSSQDIFCLQAAYGS